MSIDGDQPRPLVSAIVAAYNYGRYLPRTLDSALAQNYPADRLEIVVVDDGSTDETPAILAEYAARYPGRVRALRQENAGYVAATNRAFAEARGELWALLDADDLWPPDKTIRQVEIFLSRPEVGAVYGDLEIIDPDDNVVRPSHWQHDGVVPVRGAGALVRLLEIGNCACASSIMVRAALRDRFAPVPEGVPYVDWWTVIQASAVSELEYVLEPRVGYREHGGNLTLGAQGHRLTRELVKQSMTRRQALIHGAAALLPAASLVPAWGAVERDGAQAAQVINSVFVGLPVTSDEDRAAGAFAASRAAVLERRGHVEQALRCRVTALAHDPFDQISRTAVVALGPRLQEGDAEDPLPVARSFVVLATLADISADPDLLARFAAAFGSDDDCSLVIHAPGVAPDVLEGELGRAMAAAGVGADVGSDMIVLGDGYDAATLEAVADVTLHAGDDRPLGELFQQALGLLTGAPS